MCDKVRYLSLKQAKKALRSCQRRNRRERRIYFCGKCHGFHATSERAFSQ